MSSYEACCVLIWLFSSRNIAVLGGAVYRHLCCFDTRKIICQPWIRCFVQILCSESEPDASGDDGNGAAMNWTVTQTVWTAVDGKVLQLQPDDGSATTP